MAKLTYDTTGVDPNKPTGFEPYEGPVPKPGTYYGEIAVCKMAVGKDSGNDYIKVMYRLGPNSDPEKAKTKGAPIWDNVVPGESEFQQIRLAQLMNSICGKPKAIVDFDDDSKEVKTVGGKKPVGTKVRLVLSRDSYNGEPQARVQDVFPLKKGEAYPTGDEADMSGLDEFAPAEEEEEADSAAEEAEEDDEFETRKAELEGMTLVKLKAAAKEWELDVTALKKKEDLVEAILAEEFPEEDEEAEDEEAEEEEEDDSTEEAEEDEQSERRAELEQMDRAGLKAALKEADPDFKVLKRHTDEELLEAVLAAEFATEDADDEEAPF